MPSRILSGGNTAKEDGTHNEIGQSITYYFMRYFRDCQRALDFGTIAGCACPSQYNFAIEDCNQPGKKRISKVQRGLDD